MLLLSTLIADSKYFCRTSGWICRFFSGCGRQPIGGFDDSFYPSLAGMFRLVMFRLGHVPVGRLEDGPLGDSRHQEPGRGDGVGRSRPNDDVG